jgi:hypothetical protein
MGNWQGKRNTSNEKFYNSSRACALGGKYSFLQLEKFFLYSTFSWIVLIDCVKHSRIKAFLFYFNKNRILIVSSVITSNNEMMPCGRLS